MFGIGRRAFITLLGASVALPCALPAQPSAIPVIGFLHHASPDVAEALRTAF
jgi:ABC-type uncharacterized transport system substrate-binding protein